MEFRKSDIVCSLAGHDKGQLYFVIEVENGLPLLTDGKGRKLDKLKRKNPKHLRLIAADGNRVSEKIRNGEKLTDSEIRRSLRQTAAEALGEIHGE